MFAKSLIVAASLALTSEAVKIKTGLSANALAGVNVRALSKAELQSLLAATQDDYEQYKANNGKHWISNEENTVRHTNWLDQQSYNQSHNANENSSAQFGDNQFSDMTQEEKDAVNGAKVDDNDALLLANKANRYGFSLDMTTEEYQDLYNEKFNEWTKSCERFDNQFNQKDEKYLTNQESKQYNKKVNKKGWSEDDFDSWWMRIMQDRTVAQASIERCFGSDEEEHEEEEEENNDDETNPNPAQCSASNSEFIWGDNVVVPIKNQGQCGSCYSFSAMTVLESALAIQTETQVMSFSEQQVVDCQNDYSGCYGCNGGWPVSMHQSTRQTPIVLTADYPYTGKEASCNIPGSSETVAADDVYYIDGDAESVKEALCVGPITLTVKANGPFMSYGGGVMTSADCPYNNDLDHAVAAIGWKVMDGQEVLIVRNSWGTWWGVDGYIYMAMDDGNNGMGPCGIFHYPSSATVRV